LIDAQAPDGLGPQGPGSLDQRALQQWVDAHLGAFGRIQAIEKFPGGQSNPTHLVRTDSGAFVLRRKPSGVLLPSAHAVDREYRVLKGLQGTAVPVPAVYAYCEDSSVVGSAFYAMEYVVGRVYWDPELPTLPNARRTAIYADMNRVLAALHSVVPSEVGLGDYGKPGGYFGRQIRRWTEQYRAADTGRRDAIERLIEWLPQNLPADDGQVALVHGDFRLDNLIFDEADRVIAVLDWELSTLGHPYADLAYQCAQWRLPAGAMRGLDKVDRTVLGIPAERDYVRDYLQTRGLPPVAGWTFYLALSLFRLASICQGVYRRGLEGNASSTDARGFGEKVDIIAATAMRIIDSPNSD
jgi:aminoglycoside phosphotransferase (APT) family kinase protein